MIITHNLMSMGACRQSKITTARKARTSERLASGYRINRAADDAAGLSISQKMRAQIRGLNQANENIQDGISFVQIGEGGMQEVHDILQRIRELSVKAANGTNTMGDRVAIQSEIDALKAEIDDIAYKTSFNEHYMLCGESTRVSGGGGGTGSVIDPALSDALSNRVTYGGSANDVMGNAIYNADGTIVFCGRTESSDQDLDGAATSSGRQGGWVTKVGTDGEVLWATKINETGTESLNSITATADGGYLAVGNRNGHPFLTKLDADGGVTWKYEFQCTSGSDNNVNNVFLMQDGSGHVFLSIQSFSGNSLKDGFGNPLGGSALGGRDTIMMVVDPSVDPNTDYAAFEKKAYRVGGSSNEQISKLWATTDGGYIGGNYTTSSDIKQSNNDGSVNRPPTTVIGTGHHRSFITKFDRDGNVEKVLLFGDNGSAGNSGETVSQIIETSAGEYLVVGTAEITDTVGSTPPFTDRSHGSNIWVMKLDKNLNPIWSKSYGSSLNDSSSCVVETENGFVIAGRVGAMDGDVSSKAGYSGTNAWVFMIDKDSGDIIWDEVHGGSGNDSFSFVFEDTNGDILLGGNSSSDDEDLADKNKGSGDAWFLKLNGQTGGNVQTSGSGSGGRISLSSGSIYLRVGPYCGNRFQIDYADMRTAAVFGRNANLNVLSQSAADEAMILCDKAISYVCEWRSRYGCYQNALEHLYNANANTAENVTASESRIADADIADEMVAFSCDQILQQTNATVLTQANMANQTVLKLLQDNV